MQDMRKEFQNRKTVIFGAGRRGMSCLSLLRRIDVRPYCFFDNRAEEGDERDGIPVFRPLSDKDAVVIITVKDRYDEIASQLLGIGYSPEAIYTMEHLMGYLQEKERPVSRYPATIQLPITHLCNFDCVMCGMHHMIGRPDFTAEELGRILKDDLFGEVTSVGVNGGEPFLKKDLADCIRAIITNCPKTRDLFFISNGYFTERIRTSLREIRNVCADRNVCIHLSLSLDGVEDMQDFHRGCKNSYRNLVETLHMLRTEGDLTDDLDIICTVTRYNIFRIREVEAFSRREGIPVAYNIATENVRIENEDRLQDFSLFSDETARHLAMEFFYAKYMETRSEKYFGLFLYLRDKRRYAECPCRQNEWVTLTPDCELGYCATHSKKLGNALERSAREIYDEHLSYLDEIKETYCEGCSHYGYHLGGEGYAELYHHNLLIDHRLWREGQEC